MTEISFPVVDKPLSEDEWKTIALGFGQGIIDRGGWPYLMGTKDNVNNTITINVDQVTGRNEAILSGFVHRIDSPKVIDIPAVTTTTTYEIGLVYDPLKHNTAEGPITLTRWTAPGDYTQGKNRLVLYRVTRNANQVLSDATVTENRQRISPQLSVSNVADLPKVETLLVDTVALVRNTNEWYRLNKPGTGPMTWSKVGGTDPLLATATWEPVGDTLMKRHANGSAHVEVGTGGKSAINKDYLDSALGGDSSGAPWLPATPNATGHSIMRRWDSGVSRVKFDAAHPDNIVNVSGGDARYRRLSTAIDGRDLNKTGNDVWWEIISGSLSAYNSVQSGTVFTVSVNSSGKFMRFSSAKKYKRNWKPWLPAPRSLTGVDLWSYQRVTPEGEVDETWEVGLLADDHEKDGLEPFVQYGPDPTTGEHGVEDFDYLHWTVAGQRLHEWNTARVDAILKAVERIAEATGVDLTDLLDGLEWGEGER